MNLERIDSTPDKLDLDSPGRRDYWVRFEHRILVKRGIFKNNIIRKPCNYKLDFETNKEVDIIFKKLTEALNSND